MAEDPAASRIRVFAAGIGGSVGEDDIKKIFAKFGEIERVEIVRTKGRGFAYFDLTPSKPNSLNNLLSTYNGCAWKGGKLRLEKAREHYLSRLRREWAEDSELSATPVEINGAEKSTAIQEKSKKFLESEKQLCMYFPKLRKVKSLPFRGTGKHKYSFQRVDVPPTPKHFCDCDEHTDLTGSVKMEKAHENDILDGGIEAGELDLMKSVMYKLFQEKKCLESIQNVAVVPEDNSPEKNVAPAIEDNNGTLVDDADDLVINIMSDAGNTNAMNQIEAFGRKNSNTRDAPKDNSVQKLMDRQNGNATPSRKRQKSVRSAEYFADSKTSNNDESVDHSNASVEEDDDDLVTNVASEAGKPKAIIHMSDFIAQEKSDSNAKDELKNQTSKKRQKSLNSVGALSKDSSVASEDEFNSRPNVPGETCTPVSTGSKLETNRPNEQPLWSRKSPWKALIGSGDDKSFSISNILASHNLESDKKTGPDDSKVSTEVVAEDPTAVPSEDIEDEAVQPQNLADARIETSKGDPSFSKSGRGSHWLHHSSWTQLVNSRDTPFSISHILPVTVCERNDLTVDKAPVKEGSDRPPSGQEGLQKSVRSSVMVSQAAEKQTWNDNITASSRERDSQKSSAKMPAFSVNEESQRFATRVLMIGPDEPCLFMRNEASLRDWANTKAALTGSRKRKK